MLDFFTIFSKGGIVLWYFQGTVGDFTNPVNELIKSVVLQERSGSGFFNHNQLAIKYKLDNEFELVFVVGYQNILQLSYIDKFLSDIQLQFRDRYKNRLILNDFYGEFDFNETFTNILMENEHSSRVQKREMKPFETSNKAKKIMMQRGTLELSNTSKKDDKKSKSKDDGAGTPKSPKGKTAPKSPTPKESPSPARPSSPVTEQPQTNGEVVNGTMELTEDQIIEQKRALMMKGMLRKKKPAKPDSKTASLRSDKKKGKEARTWNGGNVDAATLDYSSAGNSSASMTNGDSDLVTEKEKLMVGQMEGDLKSIDVGDDVEDIGYENEDEKKNNSSANSGGSVFSFFKGLAGQKAITPEAIAPVLEKMKEHLISKNVAADIASKLCNSVSAKLEGKVLGTFTGVASAVRSSMQESLVQILSPKKRVDILRDVMEAKRKGKPYTIVFCGVNGVGKSTNLAKICFWLMENNHRVMIAACDTFRSGAVEQLRTHQCRLKALHPKGEKEPEKVMLYDKGYGKDAAAVSMEAINLARDLNFDVVLVDTAGRMQDNEPLMRSLAKLIKINEPDLVLFVGEALVGNDGVDQLRKFNQALADHSDVNNPHLIDGIVLTKFDTIDDKVGASISMTYETGQPIVFVGTGQTYTDLRNLNVNAVVKALLKS